MRTSVMVRYGTVSEVREWVISKSGVGVLEVGVE